MSSAAANVVPPRSEAIPAYSHAQIKRVVTGIMLCILLAALDQTVVIPAVPAMAAELNAFGHLSWIVSAYLVTSTAATPILAKLSDGWGRRALLLPSLVLFMVASALCALCTSLPALIAARALQGLGGAGLMSMSQAAVADVVAPRERGRYQGYMASMWGIASIAGPVVGGWMTDHLSWRFVFWINIPVGIAAMLLCDRALRLLPVRGGRVRIDVPGALLLVSAISCWLLVLSWGGTEYPWLSSPVVGTAAAAALLTAALVWQERRAPDPVLPPRLFANGAFARGVMISFCTVGTMLGVTFLLPLYYQLVRGQAASDSGVLLIPFLLANVFGAFAGGQLARRLGRTKALIMNGLTASVVPAAAFVVLPAGVPEVVPLVLSAVLGFGIGITMPTVLMQVQNAAARPDVGAATGAMLFIRSMGGALGATLAGSLLTLVFTSGLAGASVAGVDLGNAREKLEELAGPVRDTVLGSLSAGFHAAFAACAGLLLVGWLIGAGMKDQLLQSGEVPKDIGH